MMAASYYTVTKTPTNCRTLRAVPSRRVTGYLKTQVFKAPAPHTVQELKHRIQQEVKGIPVEMLLRVMGDVRKSLAECLERNGGLLNDVIFRK